MTTLVFDLGGVLVDWDPRHVYREVFAGDEDRMEWFLANICTNEWNHRHDQGVPFEQNCAELALRHPEWAEEIDAYRVRWKEMLKGEIAESVELLKELRDRGYPLYALTNWSKETFPIAKATFPFFSWFRGIVVSGEIGVAKPDKRIFQYMLDTYNINPKASVYVDDRETNVSVARELGFQAHLFESAAKLRSDLAMLLK